MQIIKYAFLQHGDGRSLGAVSGFVDGEEDGAFVRAFAAYCGAR